MLGTASRPRRAADDVEPRHGLVEDLGIDSLSFMEIVIAVENRYQVFFEDDYLSIDAFERVESLFAYVQGRITRS